MKSALANTPSRTESSIFNSKRPMLEDHVNSIIAAGGPSGALKKRYQYDFLCQILDKIHEREELLDLKAYHFMRTSHRWKFKDGSKNFALAREATGTLVELLRDRHGWSYEQIIENIRQEHFHKTRIGYGAKLAGMLVTVYDDSPSKAMIDYLQNHPSSEVREQFKDLKPYHFKNGQKHIWKLENGRKNYELARRATGELLEILREKYGWDYEQVIKNIQQKHFYKEKIRFGATLNGMLSNVYEGSPSKAVVDFLKHHQNKKIRSKYRDLGGHHFRKAPQNSWTLPDGKQNRELGRRVVHERIEELRARYGWSISQVKKNLCYKHFYLLPLKYGSTAGGAIDCAFGTFGEAMRDYWAHRRELLSGN